MKKIGLLLALFTTAMGVNAFADDTSTECQNGQVYSDELQKCVPAPTGNVDDSCGEDAKDSSDS